MWLIRLSKPFIRFRLNSRHNRFFVVFGGFVYLRNIWGEKILSRHVVGESRQPPQDVIFYSRANWKGLLTKPAAGTIALTIPHLGRFGNAMADFIPALARALQLGIGHVIIHGDSVIGAPDGLIPTEVYQMGPRLQLWAGKEPRARENGVLHLVSPKSLNFSIDSESANEAWQLAFNLMFGADSVGPEPEGCLVIHLRGGDVYGARLLPNHGQPPLSYYTRILAEAGWESVKIVHQGPNIPVLQPLIEHCRKLGLPVETHSKSFQEDMVALLGARTLVVGRGSFAPAVVGLSPWVRKVYYFQSGFGLNPPKSGLSLQRLYDHDGEFVRTNLHNLWRNTPEQVHLMLTYPEVNLASDPVHFTGNPS